MVNSNSEMDTRHYSAETTAILNYLHTGMLDFNVLSTVQTIIDECSKVLEADFCTDEALNDAIKFNQNCRNAANNCSIYERPAISDTELVDLTLDEFSYYLLTIKTLPTSHNLKQFRKYHYLALHIIAQVIELGKRAQFTMQPHASSTELALLAKVHAVYCLLRDKETRQASDPEASSNLLETYTKDFLTRGGKEELHIRIHTAVKNMYQKQRAQFSALEDVEVAKILSENDTLLDYYFHASTPKNISIEGQHELENKGYLTMVLAAVRKVRAS